MARGLERPHRRLEVVDDDGDVTALSSRAVREQKMELGPLAFEPDGAADEGFGHGDLGEAEETEEIEAGREIGGLDLAGARLDQELGAPEIAAIWWTTASSEERHLATMAVVAG